MKTAHEFVQSFATYADGWYFVTDEDAKRHDDALEYVIEARDAEHRAELLKLQDDLLQAANREVAMETEIERLRRGLGEARGFIRRVASVCGQVRQPSPQEFEALRIVARWDAPTPAESTPAQPAQPDDIRERLERLERLAWSIESGAASLFVAERDNRQRIDDDHERRLTALEAKGEPGTHAFVPWKFDVTRCGHPTTHTAVCGESRSHPSHPKGAKP